jgi:hypothetical protein
LLQVAEAGETVFLALLPTLSRPLRSSDQHSVPTDTMAATATNPPSPTDTAAIADGYANRRRADSTGHRDDCAD